MQVPVQNKLITDEKRNCAIPDLDTNPGKLNAFGHKSIILPALMHNNGLKGSIALDYRTILAKNGDFSETCLPKIMDHHLQRQLLSLARVNLNIPDPFWIQEIPGFDDRTPLKVHPENSDFFLHYIFHALKLGTDRCELYVDYMAEATNKSGQESLTELNLSFNPSVESLEIHRISVFRDGRWYEIDPEDLYVYPLASENQEKVLSNLWCVHPILSQSIKGSRLRFSYSIHTDLRLANSYYSEAYTPIFKPCGWFKLGVLLSDVEVARRFHFQGDFNHCETQTDYGVLHTFDIPCKPLPAFEPGSLQLHELGESLYLSTIPTWGDFGSWIDREISGFQLNVKELPEELQEIVASAQGQAKEVTINKIIHWVAQNINYFSVTLERSGYLPRNPQEVLKKGWGDCKDKSLALKCILEMVGVESHLALLNNDLLARQRFPIPGFFFNHCILWIGDPDSGYPVDPTSVFQLDPRHIPDFSRSMLLILDGRKTKFIEVAESEDFRYFQQMHLHLNNKESEPTIKVQDRYSHAACGQIIQGLQNDSSGFFHSYRLHLQEHFSGEITALEFQSEIDEKDRSVRLNGTYQGVSMVRSRAAGQKVVEWRAWLIYSLVGKYFSSLQRNLPLVTESAKIEETLEWEGFEPIGKIPREECLNSDILTLKTKTYKDGSLIKMHFSCEMKSQVVEASEANELAGRVQDFLEAYMNGCMHPLHSSSTRLVIFLWLLLGFIAFILLNTYLL
ncbi:DUF3857 domain-containing protein [bacterium]|nr:DUF3857 domain-containing protein [bacterium]